MKTQILSFLFLLLGINLFSQTWISFDGITQSPKKPEIMLVSSNNQEVSIDFNLFGTNSTIVNNNGINYQRLQIPSCINSISTGYPELPVISKMIAIPECTSIVATITNASEMTYTNYTIYPAPEIVGQYVDEIYSTSEVFTKNETAYSLNNFSPQNRIEISTTGHIRDQKYAQFAFYPIQYNPVTGCINVITSCTINIEFIGATTDVNIPTGLFNNVVSNSLFNYPGDGKTASTPSNSLEESSVSWIDLTNVSQLDDLAIDYLIITASQFWEPNNQASQVRRLIHRATSNGYHVGILNTDQILNDGTGILPTSSTEPNYWREQKIRNCIKRIYDNHLAINTFDGHLAYVLLIGDAQVEIYNTNTSYGVPSAIDPSIIPYFGPNWGFPSDNYYALLTFDSFGSYDPIPDMYIGRFPVNNSTELFNMVEKTIKYETEFSNQQFNHNTLFSNCSEDLCSGYLTDPLGVYQDLLPTIITSPYTYHLLDENVIGSPTSEMVVDRLNEGVFLFEYYGHSHFDYLSFDNNLTTLELQSQLTNDYETPFFFAHSCYAGLFNTGGYLGQDCLAEVLVRYSPTRGFVGSLAASAQAVLNCGPPNGNWPGDYIDMIPFSIFENASSVTGEFILQSKILVQSNVFPGYVVQGNFYFNYLGDPALNLMAQGYQITHDTQLNGNTIISNDVHVCDGYTLRLSGNVHFEQAGRLIIDNGATLIFNGSCTLNGVDAYNAIEVNGEVFVDGHTERQFVTFTAPINKSFTGLILNNPIIDVTFPILNLCRAAVFGNKLSSFKIGENSSERSVLDNSPLYFQTGNVEIKYADFIRSYANLRNSNIGSSSSVKISYCTFNGDNGEPLINIQDYLSFDIEENTLNFSRYDGISLYNSGFSTTLPHIINHNTINFFGSTYNNNNGIKVYHSQVDIMNNTITNASYGISCLNNSNIKVSGNCSATGASSTQQIVNNRENQIFAALKDFPYEVKFNHFDNTINQKPLIYYDLNLIPSKPYLNVTCNHWGVPFTPSTDLYPFGIYIYSPTWNYNNCFCGSAIPAEKFNMAEASELDEDYTTAELLFKDIIENNSESEYASASVNELYSINTINNSLVDLQDYLGSLSIPDSLELLASRVNFAGNWCNIDLQNYSEAIQWFENKLLNPASIEDSIFAIIDMNYTYLRSQNDSSKSAVVCKYPELIAKNHDSFVTRRKELIDLLYKKGETVGSSLIEKAVVMNLFPNPVVNNLRLEIISNSESNFNGQIRVFDELGRVILEDRNFNISSGSNIEDINLSNILPGVYYICLVKDHVSLANGKFVKLP